MLCATRPTSSATYAPQTTCPSRAAASPDSAWVKAAVPQTQPTDFDTAIAAVGQVEIAHNGLAAVDANSRTLRALLAAGERVAEGFEFDTKLSDIKNTQERGILITPFNRR